MASNQYFRLAVLYYAAYQENLQAACELLSEIDQLKRLISSKQTKFRRCDKDLIKTFNCALCDKIYASKVSLSLHVKLKHKEKSELSSNSLPTEDVPAEL